MSFDPQKLLDQLPEGFEYSEHDRLGGKFKGSKDKYFVKKREDGKKMYTIVGKKKTELFIEKYKECNDEYSAAVQANVLIAKWVKDEHEPATPIKRASRVPPKRKSSPKTKNIKKAKVEKEANVEQKTKDEDPNTDADDSEEEEEEDDEEVNEDNKDKDSSEDDVDDDIEEDDVKVEAKSTPKTTPKKTKKPTEKITKLPAKVPKSYLLHTFFTEKYTKAEVDFICGVVDIDSPEQLLKYDQLRLARELEYWWKLQQTNFFGHNEVDVNLDFCRGIVYSWYMKAMDYRE